jgi:predicted AlkP superfamily pyrophosphatase or phosphodiesterase
MKNKLFVISIDALVREDIAYMETKPNFSRIMEGRAEVERVTSVYPALTYPAHTTLITGCRPGLHGVCDNTPLKTYADGKPRFYLHSKYIRTEDLFAAAKRAGCSTAAVYWPITAFNPNIDHVLNEYFFYFPGETQHVEEIFARIGADEAALQAVRENMDRFPTAQGSGLNIRATYDNFLIGCTCSLIRNEKPDVLFVHACDVDTYRHYSGAFGPRVKDALDQMDLWLGEIAESMESAGIYEQTNFVILSDHGQMNFDRNVKLNTLLARGGFLEPAPDGTVYSWQAIAKSNGMSAQIYLKDKADRALCRDVYAYLQHLAEEGCWGIEKVFSEEETRALYGTYGPFAFTVESDGHTNFSDEWTEPPLIPARGKISTHGYRPEKGPQPVFMGRGPAFRPGAVLPTARLMDIAPTFAEILGQPLPQAEGRPLRELLA